MPPVLVDRLRVRTRMLDRLVSKPVEQPGAQTVSIEFRWARRCGAAHASPTFAFDPESCFGTPTAGAPGWRACWDGSVAVDVALRGLGRCDALLPPTPVWCQECVETSSRPGSGRCTGDHQDQSVDVSGPGRGEFPSGVDDEAGHEQPPDQRCSGHDRESLTHTTGPDHAGHQQRPWRRWQGQHLAGVDGREAAPVRGEDSRRRGCPTPSEPFSGRCRRHNPMLRAP